MRSRIHPLHHLRHDVFMHQFRIRISDRFINELRQQYEETHQKPEAPVLWCDFEALQRPCRGHTEFEARSKCAAERSVWQHLNLETGCYVRANPFDNLSCHSSFHLWKYRFHLDL